MTINNLLEKVVSCSVNMQFLLLETGEQLMHAGSGLHELLGYTERDFIQSKLHLADFIHTDDQDIAITLFSLKIQDTPKIVNFRCRQANGKIICLQGGYQKHFDKKTGLKLVLQLTDAKTLNAYLDDPILLSNFTTMMKNSEEKTSTF